MQKCISDYLDIVCMSIRKKSLRELARNELKDHMLECCAELTSHGMEPEKAAQETVKRMGDPETLAKKIAVANRSIHGIVTLCCGTLLFILILACVTLVGSEIQYYIDMPSFIGVVGLSAAYGLLSCKGKPALFAFIRSIKSGALYSGCLCVIIGILNLLNNLSDNPHFMEAYLAVALMPMFYAIILSMAAKAIELRLTAPKNEIIKELVE